MFQRYLEMACQEMLSKIVELRHCCQYEQLQTIKRVLKLLLYSVSMRLEEHREII